MAESTSTNAPELLLKNELHGLVERAEAGDPTALHRNRIRQILDDHPEVWRHVGDLSTLVEHAWIAVLSANDPLAAEAIRRTVKEMKTELGGEHPSPLEKMLVGEIVAAWLEVKFLNTVSAGKESDWVAREALHLRRRESAHNRYLGTIKALTTMRALLPTGLALAKSPRLYTGLTKKA